MVIAPRAAQVLETAEAFLASVAWFDASDVTIPDCVAVAALAARVEKAASGVRVMAASRAAAEGAHKEAGCSDPASWLARQGGTTGGAAREALALAKSLDAHPATKEALLSGEVSVSQAEEILRCAAEVPSAEESLLETARNGDLTKVRDEARDHRLSSRRPEDLHRRQLAARRFHHWKDDLGMIRLDGALPPETGIRFVNRIEREATRLHGEAKREGDPEPFSAYAADALGALAVGSGTEGSTKTDLVIVCDLYAWRRGHAHEGEACHIVGGGPIPVDLAHELAADAFLKVVLHDGTNIHTVSHHGRHLPAVLRTALDLGPVPAFSGRSCVDCQRRYGIEYDHTDPYANGGPTSYANLQARCWPCHADKTERDRAAGHLGKRAKARGRPTARTRADKAARAGRSSGTRWPAGVGQSSETDPPTTTGPPATMGPSHETDPPGRTAPPTRTDPPATMGPSHKTGPPARTDGRSGCAPLSRTPPGAGESTGLVARRE